MVSPARRAKRIDEVQPGIVSLLRAYGAIVFVIADPFDLLVGYRGAWHIMEVKSPGGRLTSAQERNLQLIGDTAKVHIVHSFEEAINVLKGRKQAMRTVQDTGVR